MKTTVAVLFYIKRAKINNESVCPIYVRVTVNTKRFEFSSNRYVNPNKWSVEGSKVKGNNDEARTINSHLAYLKNQVFEAENKLFKKDDILNSENLKNEMLGVNKSMRMLIPIFHEHNNKIKELIGKGFAPGTLDRYKTSLSHTIEFLQWKYKVSDIDITKIDHAFITDYDFWLRSVRNCANNTAVKYIKNFQKIVKICLNNDWIIKNPFNNYKVKLKEVEREYLNEEELKRLFDKDLKIERLVLVRDIFLFSCYTGLAYIDVKNLTKENINIGIDSEKWIFTHRQKTESASKIPLLPIAEMILEKYKNHPQCLNQNKLMPILTNQRMNSYLKEIADVCYIHKSLTFHIARHTFATTVTLTNGVPIETVSKMLGHKNIQTTQHYAKILDKKVSEDMMILRKKFSVNLNINNLQITSD